MTLTGWWRHEALAVAAAAPLVAAVAGCVPVASPDAGSSATAAALDPQRYADELFDLTNDVRAREDLPALVPSDCARGAALARAAQLVGAATLDHAPMDDVLAGCPPATQAAENLSRATASPREVVAAWMESPGHRANLLSSTVTELGVGCIRQASQMLCSQVYLGP